MKKSIVAVCLTGWLWAGSTMVQAADVQLTISTGKSGGGYYGIGERLKTVMAEQGVTVEVLTSVGSLENLNRLNDPGSPVNVGLTQADALKYFLGKQPEMADKFMMLGEIGKECVFIISDRKSGIDSDSDLQDKKGNLIAVQSPNSGVAVTYEYMTQLEPKFKNTAPAFVDAMEALLQIKSGGPQNKIKAAMLVQRPSAKSPPMQVVLDNPKEFQFVSVTDWDLNDKLPDGTAVYTFEDVTVEKKNWGFDTKVDTICTRGLMIGAKDKLSPDLRENLAKVMLLAPGRVVGE
ncbi:MAG: hypothetical protein H6970_04725 [Gammaproteobacteria bacterium]|nr:hypothetical protein [Gammaproteobacteria bacterium]MCP5424353.1 hypothetical protein [Gammaproteobacteria bacterium]MCP5459104.1 hypothetical protein [Gammaproteobacteria bacterium]